MALLQLSLDGGEIWENVDHHVVIPNILGTGKVNPVCEGCECECKQFDYIEILHCPFYKKREEDEGC